MSTLPVICICLEVNRAARALTARYDVCLAPHHLTSGQFAVLMALRQMGQGTMGQIARIIGLDRTTLTRNLAPLRAAGLIGPAPSTDARQRPWQLTEAGVARFESAQPAWQQAHQDSLARLGRAGWTTLAGLTRELAD